MTDAEANENLNRLNNSAAYMFTRRLQQNASSQDSTQNIHLPRNMPPRLKDFLEKKMEKHSGVSAPPTSSGGDSGRDGSSGGIPSPGQDTIDKITNPNIGKSEPKAPFITKQFGTPSTKTDKSYTALQFAQEKYIDPSDLLHEQAGFLREQSKSIDTSKSYVLFDFNQLFRGGMPSSLPMSGSRVKGFFETQASGLDIVAKEMYSKGFSFAVESGKWDPMTRVGEVNVPSIQGGKQYHVIFPYAGAENYRELKSQINPFTAFAYSLSSHGGTIADIKNPAFQAGLSNSSIFGPATKFISGFVPSMGLDLVFASEQERTQKQVGFLGEYQSKDFLGDITNFGKFAVRSPPLQIVFFEGLSEGVVYLGGRYAIPAASRFIGGSKNILGDLYGRYAPSVIKDIPRDITKFKEFGTDIKMMTSGSVYETGESVLNISFSRTPGSIVQEGFFSGRLYSPAETIVGSRGFKNVFSDYVNKTFYGIQVRASDYGIDIGVSRQALYYQEFAKAKPSWIPSYGDVFTREQGTTFEQLMSKEARWNIGEYIPTSYEAFGEYRSSGFPRYPSLSKVYGYTIFDTKANTVITRSYKGSIIDFSKPTMEYKPELATGKFPAEFNIMEKPSKSWSWEKLVNIKPELETGMYPREFVDINYPQLITKNRYIQIMGRNIGRTGKQYYASFDDFSEVLGTGKQINRRPLETIFRTEVKQSDYGAIKKYANFEYIHDVSTINRSLTYEEFDLLNKAEEGLYARNMRLPEGFAPPSIKQFLGLDVRLIDMSEYVVMPVSTSINRSLTKGEQGLVSIDVVRSIQDIIQGTRQVVIPVKSSAQVQNTIPIVGQIQINEQISLQEIVPVNVVPQKYIFETPSIPFSTTTPSIIIPGLSFDMSPIYGGGGDISKILRNIGRKRSFPVRLPKGLGFGL